MDRGWIFNMEHTPQLNSNVLISYQKVFHFHFASFSNDFHIFTV